MFTNDTREKLATKFREERFSKNTIIYDPKDMDREQCFYYIDEGTVNVNFDCYKVGYELGK